jgi:hypothetical protein
MNFRVQVGDRCFLQIFTIYQTTRRRIPEDGKLHFRMCYNTMRKDMGGNYDGLSVNTTVLFLRTATLF